jgi:molybdenum cofactor cytidylyltransferase
MRFGPVPVEGAAGAILAHSLLLPDRHLKKGRVISPQDAAAMAAAGMAEVVAVRLDPADVAEDAAAARLAAALVPDPGAAHLALTEPFAGRVNLNATAPGVLEVDADAVHALNRIDPAITFATLAPWTRVTPGMLAGTVKIITYGVDGERLSSACAAARGALRVRPVTRPAAALILSEVPRQPARVTAKGRRATEARLAALGMRLSDLHVVPHATEAIAAALAAARGDMVLILTGSATSDAHDVAPEAVRMAGGTVHRYGMPVDPGNLLFVGEQGGRPVIGLPGCARSPALNGADFVLERLACGVPVGDAEIAAMGVGGLLKEIPSRPQPRERSRRGDEDG